MLSKFARDISPAATAHDFKPQNETEQTNTLQDNVAGVRHRKMSDIRDTIADIRMVADQLEEHKKQPTLTHKEFEKHISTLEQGIEHNREKLFSCETWENCKRLDRLSRMLRKTP